MKTQSARAPGAIGAVLAGHTAPMARFDRLAKQPLDVAEQEFRYPSAHVAVKSDEPFAVKRRGDVVALARRWNDSEYAFIWFIGVGKMPHPDYRQYLLSEAAKSAIEGLGSVPSIVDETPWRDRLSSSTHGIVTEKGATSFVSVRTVEVSEFEGALVFLVNGPTKEQARAARQRLEKATRVLP